jgi:AsmA family protein
MKTLAKIGFFLFMLVLLGLVGVVIALQVIDTDQYRPQIIDALSKQTGRTVKLDGPIKFSLSWHGVTLSVQDAAIGNPTWASRPDMAGIGHFDLGIALLPLIDHRLVVTEFDVVNADIQLETGTNDKHNWEDMTPSTAPAVKTGVPVDKKTNEVPSKNELVAIGVDHLSIQDSQLAVRDKNGKVTAIKIKSLVFGLDGNNTLLHILGEYNNDALSLNMRMGTTNLLSKTEWPFEADVIYADYRLNAKGKVSLESKSVDISPYAFSAGNSDIHGQLTAHWDGARPVVKGTLESDRLDPSDFKKVSIEESGGSVKQESNASSAQHIFSTAPLDRDGLKSIDALVDVAVAHLIVSHATLDSVKAKVDLSNGHLSIPVQAVLGTSPISGEIKLDGAASPAQLSFTLAAPAVDLADLLRASDINPFLSGKGVIAVNLGSSGDSAHALASNTSGTITITAAGGSVSSAEAGDISTGLMSMVAPKGGTNTLNCLAMRFIALHGLVKDNGILADTAASIISGKGNVDLGAETIDLTLNARTKLVNVGGLLPGLHVGGNLLAPHFGVDSSAMVQGVVGILTSGGNLGAGATDLTAPAGQNACVYTLDHTSPGGGGEVYQSLTDQVTDKVKDAGGSLLKGLFGK